MSKINLLSPLLADLIAAGEVVERPGSAVKELLENSIDAGAKSVTVEISGGGTALIRVTDDGCGMSPEDAGVAFLRHATSKLADERGLEAIGTLGFRGEALAAISAVSRIELKTREPGADYGTRVTLSAGEIQEMGKCGCPVGTAIAVRDLFFNTPARRKFLRSDRAEGTFCAAAALKSALGRPEVSVRLIHDGKEEFFTPGDALPRSAVYSLLGRDFAARLLEGSFAGDGLEVGGFVSSPRAGRGNRGLQFFFVNGRPIRSPALQTALEQAYKNTLLTGRFPACVLYITLSNAAVDVNVHPAKAEVKFSDERAVTGAVYGAARAALEREAGPVAAPVSAPTVGRGAPGAPAPKQEFFQRMDADQFWQKIIKDPGDRERSSLPLHEPAPVYAPSPIVQIPREKPVSAPEPNPARKPEPVIESPPRLVGEALGTYIIVEVQDSLVLIDKHAAHERVLFDRLRAEKGPHMSQALLGPLTFSPGGAETELLLQNLETLEALGFALEPYGEGAVVLRAVPADTDPSDAVPLLEELLEKLRVGRGADFKEELLYSVACKAAIKAGKSSEMEELMELAKRVLSGEIKYCPHGRPVSVTITKKELDKQFKRIV
ncbi:MAG: DNA mismatch repair endonuclease MutL [Firmicutes bacterium]|nr:DNA mismatch repair endonuclease MutL [Bacillota bacterium]